MDVLELTSDQAGFSLFICFCDTHRKFTLIPEELTYQNTYEYLKGPLRFWCKHLLMVNSFKDKNNKKQTEKALRVIWSTFSQKNCTQNTFSALKGRKGGQGDM